MHLRWQDKASLYRLVPKRLDENLAFRAQMVRHGASSREAAQDLWIACKRDPLFYVNTFVWTYDPREPPGCKTLPFVTYPYQDDALMEILDAVGNHDLLFEKSRDMGASWLCLTALEHHWHFLEGGAFLLVSRNEDYVDKAGNPKCLFWKLDFILKHLPAFLRPVGVMDKPNRTRLHLYNEETGSVIDGESTTGDVGKGDRRTAVMLDEFASFNLDDGYRALAATADVTPCRIFNSTPQPGGRAFQEMRESGIRKIRLHWSVHPKKAAGLYHDGGGKPRSPWYDAECARRPIPMLVAQELDIDFNAADYQFYPNDLLNQASGRSVRPPYVTARLEYDAETGAEPRLITDQGGPLSLWISPDARGELPKDREYAMGIDVATGTTDASGHGASNSCICVGDRKTGEKVAEYVVNGMNPYDFARVAVALGRLFAGERGKELAGQRSRNFTDNIPMMGDVLPTRLNPQPDLVGGAYMLWEANGPGGQFGDAVNELGYGNIYYHENERGAAKRFSDRPGWYATKTGKLALLGDHRDALLKGRFIERSEACIRECRQYVYLPNGSVAHSRSVSALDPTGARENHGDRVIATALMWKGIKGALSELPEPETEIPVGSLAWRMAEAQKDKAEVYW